MSALQLELLVFVVVAINAKQFPVAAVLRIVVVIMVLVMNGQFFQPAPFERAAASAAKVRKHSQSLVAVA